MAFASRWIEIVLKGQEVTTAKEIVNVFHYLCATTPGNNTQASLATDFLANVVTAQLLPVLSINYSTISVSCRNLNDPTDPGEVIPSAAPGVVTGDNLPTFNTVTVRLTTAKRGRNYRGSKHFAVISEDDTLQDHLDAAAITAWSNVPPALIAQLTGSVGDKWDPAIYSPTLTFGPGGGGIANPTMTKVTAATVNTIIGTMKRRKVKV